MVSKMLEWVCFEEVSSLSATRSNQLPKLLKDKVSQNAACWNPAKLRQVHAPTTTTWLQKTQTQQRSKSEREARLMEGRE